MKEIALLEDERYEKGLRVHGNTHEAGYIGEIYWGKEKEKSKWTIAQWACKFNIAEGEKIGEGCYETPSQRIARYEDEGKTVLELELRASKEYDTLRKEGQEWPHLLLEQKLEDRCPTLNLLTSLEFISEVKVGYCDCKMQKEDPKMHAAQANLFMTIQHVDTGNMYWFGIPYFDSRYRVQEAYIAEDGGKADASHKLIYIIPQNRLTDQSFADYEWITYHRDIYPDILEGLKLGKEKGFLDTDDCSGYRITSLNFGWEMPGTYDASLLIRKLILKGITY